MVMMRIEEKEEEKEEKEDEEEEENYIDRMTEEESRETLYNCIIMHDKK